MGRSFYGIEFVDRVFPWEGAHGFEGPRVVVGDVWHHASQPMSRKNSSEVSLVAPAAIEREREREDRGQRGKGCKKKES